MSPSHPPNFRTTTKITTKERKKKKKNTSSGKFHEGKMPGKACRERKPGRKILLRYISIIHSRVSCSWYAGRDVLVNLECSRAIMPQLTVHTRVLPLADALLYRTGARRISPTTRPGVLLGVLLVVPAMGRRESIHRGCAPSQITPSSISRPINQCLLAVWYEASI